MTMTKKKALLTAGLSLLLVLLVASAASAQGTNLPTGAFVDDAAVLAGLRGATPAKGTGPLTDKVICVDPGHGGMDSGAYFAAYDLSESDINLDESYALRGLLEGAGATVVMTRTGDQGLTESERAAFCNQAGATIVISIHTNSFVDAEPNGVLTFYGKRSATEDVRLAQAVHDALYPALRQTAPVPSAFTDFGVRRFGAGVLRRSSMPGTLVEPAFLSNPAEAALLATPIFTAPCSGALSKNCPNYACRRGQIAQGVYRGVLAYFGGAG
jgi:N-acetylmuramoyl-L-alanine amidase